MNFNEWPDLQNTHWRKFESIDRWTDRLAQWNNQSSDPTQRRTAIRKTALVLNSITVIFFLGFLAYTFIARQHLDGLARDFVTEKTLAYSQVIVEIADEAIKSPLAQSLLSDDQTTAIRNEIAEYQNNPAAYVADLTRQQIGNISPEPGNPLLAKVTSIKEKIRTFYDNTLNALINDLRVFSASNLIAGLIAFGLIFCSTSAIRKPTIWFSFLMFVAVLYCSFLYIDGLSFFRILFRTHMGWWYAVVLCVTVVALHRDYGHHANATSQLETSGKTTAPGFPGRSNHQRDNQGDGK